MQIYNKFPYTWLFMLIIQTTSYPYTSSAGLSTETSIVSTSTALFCVFLSILNL